MLSRDKTPVIADLTEKIRRLERAVTSIGKPRTSRYLFGIEPVDRALSITGFPFAALHEIQGQTSPSDFAAANAFVASIVAHMAGGVLWCVGRSHVYSPAIAAIGLSPSKIIYAAAKNDDEILASMEEGLRHPALAAVIGEVRRLSLVASRRLILAAEKSGVAAFVLRPPLNRIREERVACATRWRISAAPSVALPVPGVGRAQWHVELLRARGGTTGNWIIEAPDAAGHFRLSQTLAGGAAPAAFGPFKLHATG